MGGSAIPTSTLDCQCRPLDGTRKPKRCSPTFASTSTIVRRSDSIEFQPLSLLKTARALGFDGLCPPVRHQVQAIPGVRRAHARLPGDFSPGQSTRPKHVTHVAGQVSAFLTPFLGVVPCQIRGLSCHIALCKPISVNLNSYGYRLRKFLG